MSENTLRDEILKKYNTSDPAEMHLCEKIAQAIEEGNPLQALRLRGGLDALVAVRAPTNAPEPSQRTTAATLASKTATSKTKPKLKPVLMKMHMSGGVACGRDERPLTGATIAELESKISYAAGRNHLQFR